MNHNEARAQRIGALQKTDDHRAFHFDVRQPGSQTLILAHERVPDSDRREFAAEFGMLEVIWETLAPDPRLDARAEEYPFLAKFYTSLQPSTMQDLTWAR